MAAARESKSTATASDLKEQGNAQFKAGEYEKAVESYTEALELDPEDAVLYSNRAAASLKVGEAWRALDDAYAAIRLRPDWEKGHFRRGCALEQQGQLDEALEAFGRGLDLNPDSKDLIERVRLLKRKIKREQAVGVGGAAAGGASGSAHCQPARVRVRAAGSGAPHMPAPDAWAQGLPGAQQYDWLVDCYRMRVDDDYAWGGGDLHGLYDPEATAESVVEDFLVFCKLAVRNRVVPPGWSWPHFLDAAAGLLPYAFEKSDAKEKWGHENVFAVLTGGRSLRATAEVVMGSSCMMGGGAGGEEEVVDAANELYEQVGDRIWHLLGGKGADGAGHVAAAGGAAAAAAEGEALFGDVGGKAAWRQLLRGVAPALRQAQHWG